MKGITLTTKGEIKIIDFLKEKLLETTYEQIDTDIVETVDVKTEKNGIPITIWCDEEGLYKERPKITARDRYGDFQIVGNLFLTPQDTDENGYQARGFTKEEIEKITKEIAIWVDGHGLRRMLFIKLGD